MVFVCLVGFLFIFCYFCFGGGEGISLTVSQMKQIQKVCPEQWLCFVIKEVTSGSVLLNVQESRFCSSHFQVKCSGNWVYEQCQVVR